MLNKIVAGEVLARAMASGADFAELFCELTRTQALSLVDGKLEKITDDVISGLGVRAFKGTETVYASTCDLSREGLLTCAARVADVISDSKVSESNGALTYIGDGFTDIPIHSLKSADYSIQITVEPGEHIFVMYGDYVFQKIVEDNSK